MEKLETNLDKKTLVIALVALAVTTAISASAFMANNPSARGYEKNQAMSVANDCGNGDLAFNVLCNNMEGEIQGDENVVGTTSAQLGITIEPYENLVDQVSMQSGIDEESARVSSDFDSTEKSRQTTAIGDMPGFTLPTPGK
jgi:hypothetical protein